MNENNNQTTRSIAKNTLYGFSTWILPLSLSFLATPIIVKSLGHQDYGIYALVLGFIGYSFTFSIGRAATKYIAEYKYKGETEKIKDVISATLFINIAVGLLSVLVICLLANWLVTDVFLIEASDRAKTVHSFYIASGIIFFLMLNQVFNAVLQGIHRFDIYSNIYNFFNILLLLGNLFLALYGFGLLSLLGWNLAVTAMMGTGFLISAKKFLPEFGINFRTSLETIRKVLQFSAGIIGYQILANILLLFERGWITRRLGAESLTYYVVPFTLALYILTFIGSLILVVFPLASELKDNRDKLLRLYFKASKIVVFFVVFIGLTLIVQSRFFLTLWMGENFAGQSWDLLIFHTLTFGLTAIASVSWQMTDGLGYPLYNAFVFSICLLISSLSMIYLTDSLGNTGIALGRLIGYATIFLSVFYVEKWIFGKIQVSFWLKMAAILILPAVLAASVEKLIIEQLPVNWFTFIVSVGAGGICYCAVLFFMGFITEDEKLILKKIAGR